MQRVKPISTTILRVVPSAREKVLSIEEAGIGSYILPKGTPEPPKPVKTCDFKDVYYVDEKREDEGISILQTVSGTYPSFNPSVSVNKYPLSIWQIYRLFDLKRMLSSYIGCPTYHITFLSDTKPSTAEKSISADLSKEIFTPSGSIILDIMTPCSLLPPKLYMFIYGDWYERKDVQLWPLVRIKKEQSVWLTSIQSSDRQSIYQTFARREELLQSLVSLDYQMHGKVTQTILSTMPSTKREQLSHTVNGKRLIVFLPLDKLTEEAHSLQSKQLKGWVTALGYKDESKTLLKVLSDTIAIPTRIKPTEYGDLSALLLVTGGTFKYIHPYTVLMKEDFSINVTSNWASSPHSRIDRATAMKASDEALNLFLDRVFNIPEEDVMTPGSVYPRSFIKTLSIASYQEEYRINKGESRISEFKTLVSKVIQGEMAKVTYLTPTSVSLQFPRYISRDRIVEAHNYVLTKVSKYGHRDVTMLWENPDALSDFYNHMNNGPEVRIKSDNKELFVTISGCSGDIEIQICSELIGKIAQRVGYQPSVNQLGSSGFDRARDFANLNLLAQIDETIFGSREQPGGAHINFSRECLKAERHPIPISIEEAIQKRDSHSIAILHNFTYGGPQAYACLHHKYKIMSLRPAAFGGDMCIPCCVQHRPQMGSLKWGKHLWCLQQMLFDPSGIEELLSKTNGSKIMGNMPIKFEGQRIIDGRMAKLPPGIQELFPNDVYLYNPPDVDVSDLHAMVEWLTGMDAPHLGTDAAFEDTIMQYIMEGLPVFPIKMVALTKDQWRASYLDVGKFYNTYPFILMVWILEGHPTVYYPLRTMDGTIVTTNDIGLNIRLDEEDCSGGTCEQLFTFETFETGMPRYSIEGKYIIRGRCYGLLIKERDHKNFFVPIQPTRVSADSLIHPDGRSKFRFPTIKEFDRLIREANKVLPYYNPRIYQLIYTDHRQRQLVGVIMYPERVVVYLTASAQPPRSLPLPDTPPLIIDQSLLDVLWLRVPVKAVPPILEETRYSKRLLTLAMIYYSEKVIRYGIVPSITKLYKRYKEEQPLSDAIRDLLIKACKRFTIIGATALVPTYGNSLPSNKGIRGSSNAIVAFGVKIKLTRELYEAVMKRLATYCPKKSPLLVAPFFRCLGTITHYEQLPIRPWEKIVP